MFYTPLSLCEVCTLTKYTWNLQNSKRNKSTREEGTALSTLWKNQDAIIFFTDKGNVTVVMNTIDCKRKIEILPSYDPYSVAHVVKSKEWGGKLLQDILLSCPPRLFELPKIHKEGTPLRSHSQRSWRTNKQTVQTRQHIANSGKYATPYQELEEWGYFRQLHSIHQDSTEAVTQEAFRQPRIAIYNFCPTSTYFLWNGRYYEQKDVVAMKVSWSLISFCNTSRIVHALYNTNQNTDFPGSLFGYIDAGNITLGIPKISWRWRPGEKSIHDPLWWLFLGISWHD